MSIKENTHSAALQNAVIFEYCEEQYSLLKKQDGHYYATKHDKIVFDKASQKFGIPIEEVNRIYFSFSKYAADLEMSRMRKMPPAERKKFIMQRAQDLFTENHDNTFYKVYGEPSNQLRNPLDIIHDEHQQLVENIATAGWTIPLDIDMKHFKQIEILSLDQAQLDSFYDKYYTGAKFRYICRKIENTLPSPARKVMFTECVLSYNQGMYFTCLDTTLSILDGIISEFGDNPTNVKVMRVCKFHEDDELLKGHKIKSLCWLSMYRFTEEIFKKSDFSQEEPDKVNRHWIQHGRSNRTPNKLDCLKVFNALSTLTNIRQAENAMS